METAGEDDDADQFVVPPLKEPETIWSLAFSPCGMYLASGGVHGRSPDQSSPSCPYSDAPIISATCQVHAARGVVLTGDIARKLDGPRLPTIRRMIPERASVCRGKSQQNRRSNLGPSSFRAMSPVKTRVDLPQEGIHGRSPDQSSPSCPYSDPLSGA
jgi:hypothetical protein